ncbi:hypothetical protein ACLKA6_014381 [Drosophila palustris]
MEPLKQNYIFDVIVVKSKLPEPSNEGGQEVDRTFSLRLFQDFVDLTPSRIEVKHFPSRPLGNFVSSPCDLIGSLSSKGICVTVYDNGEIIGSGSAMMSDPFLRQLTNQTFKANEKVSVQLQKDKKNVGTLEMNVKLSSADPDLDTRLQPFGCYDICRPLDKSVNPRDVIFTLGRSNRCAATTCITDERLMSHAGAPFNCIHAKSGPTGEECGCFIRGVKPPPELDQTKDRERNLLKKLLTDLEIDREHTPTPPSGHARSRAGGKCKCHKSNESSSSFSPMEFWSDCLYDDDDDDDDDDEDELDQGDQGNVDLLPHQVKELEQSRKLALGACPSIGAPSLTSTKYKPPLLCDVCHANITWLPKVAACPYCGYKRMDMEQPSEEPFDETATAAEVLRNHFIQTRLLNEGDEDNQKKHEACVNGIGGGGGEGSGTEQAALKKLPKECTCDDGKVCTRCRIREMCDQLFKMGSKTKVAKSLPASPQASVKALKKKTSTPSQRREQLVNIFTEMRDNYSDKKKDEISEACGKTGKSEKSGKAGKSGRSGKSSKGLKKTLKEIDESYPSLKKKKSRKTKRRPRSKRYTFLVRKEPVRPVTTHLCCAGGSGRVPCHMGWNWTKSELARHRCWKPGAIAKPIRELMAYFLRDYPVDTMGTSRRHCRRRGLDQGKAKESNPEEQLVQHPTLHISKKHDEYTITLRPLKDPKTLAVAANPYANMKPVVFRIVKDPIASGKRAIKISLKDSGFPVCSCNQPIAKCFCRSHVDKKIVEHAVNKLAQERGWQDISDTFVFDDLSESDSENELDFGVTPPAGVIKPERLHKPDITNTETQYDPNDWAMPTMFPHPPSALVQYGGCVVGERRGRFPWTLGKGFIHREAKPAKKINKPKNETKSKGRQKGGFDGGLQYDYTMKRKWHKSNAANANQTSISYDYGPIW